MTETCPFASLSPFLWDWSKTHPPFTSRSFSLIYEQQFMGAGPISCNHCGTLKSDTSPGNLPALHCPSIVFVFVRRGFDHVVAPFSHAVTVSINVKWMNLSRKLSGVADVNAVLCYPFGFAFQAHSTQH